MPRPVHFDIQADYLQRAMRFYQELFGWEFNEKSSQKGEKYGLSVAEEAGHVHHLDSTQGGKQ